MLRTPVRTPLENKRQAAALVTDRNINRAQAVLGS